MLDDEGRTACTKELRHPWNARGDKKLSLRALTSCCGARPGATCSTGRIKLNIEWLLDTRALFILCALGSRGWEGGGSKAKNPKPRCWLWTQQRVASWVPSAQLCSLFSSLFTLFLTSCRICIKIGWERAQRPAKWGADFKMQIYSRASGAYHKEAHRANIIYSHQTAEQKSVWQDILSSC